MGRPLAQRRPTGPRRSRRRSPAPRTTRRATRSGRSCSRSWSTSTTTSEVAARRCSAGRCAQNARAARRLQPGVAAARADRPRRRPVDGAGVPAQVRALARARRGPRRCSARTPQAWTVSDLPLLDAARQRLGDPEASRRRRRREAAVAAEREEMDRGRRPPDRDRRHRDAGDVDAARATDLQRRPGRRGRRCPSADPDLLAGPFAHIVVDEAQELTDAEWQMLLLRCPSRSFTIVGDRAQARHGFTESWQERLERVGLDRIDAGLAEHQLPDAGGGHGRGRAGHPRRAPRRQRADLDPQQRRPRRPRLRRRSWTRSSTTWLAEHADGIACVIGDPDVRRRRRRVRSLTPELAKGLEFDLVVLVDPESFGTGIEGAVDRYVAMTRATQQLVILTSD